MTKVVTRIQQVMQRLLYRPIHVYVFHHVSDQRDPLVSGYSDWTQSNIFYSNILALKRDYTFISLDCAYKKICSKKPRFKKFAVLTTDDGLQTVPFVLPWLEKQEVPLTCFVNAKYLDGHSHKSEDEVRIKRINPEAIIQDVIIRQYMTYEQVFNLKSPWISIGSHGFEHLNSSKIGEQQFLENVQKCQNILEKHPRYIPYFAYAWGRHNEKTDRILRENGLIPVLVDGKVNRCNPRFIHRECIDGKDLSSKK